MEENILYILTGFVAMIAGGFWGLGGGWYIVPALLLLKVDHHVATTASLIQMVGSTCFTVGRQFRSIGWSNKDDVGYAVALPLCGMALVGGYFGRFINKPASMIWQVSEIKSIVFMVLILWIFWKSLTAKKQDFSLETPFKARPFLVSVTGFLTGMTSAFLGIGGGTVNRPVLSNVLKLHETETGKICRLAVFVTALSGTVSNLTANGLDKTAEALTQAAGCFSGSAQATSGEAQSIIIALFIIIGGAVGYPLGSYIHSEVVKTGNAYKVTKSFAYIALLVLTGLICKLTGHDTFGQVALVVCGVIIAIYLFTMLFKARKLNKRAAKQA